MRHRLVTAARAMDMAWLMTSATMVRRASIRVCRRHLDDMLIDMVAFDMLQMSILKVVDMTTVTYGGVPAIRAEHMRCRHDLPRCLASLRWTLESSPMRGNKAFSLVLKILPAKSALEPAAFLLAGEAHECRLWPGRADAGRRDGTLAHIWHELVRYQAQIDTRLAFRHSASPLDIPAVNSLTRDRNILKMGDLFAL